MEVIDEHGNVTEEAWKTIMRISERVLRGTITTRVQEMDYKELLYLQDFIDKHVPERKWEQ